MNNLYLSPHLDDAVFSCGGVIWQQVNRGQQVTVVTLFSGDPPTLDLSPFARELHKRWGNDSQPYETRRAEDARALESLGAGLRHLNFPDCIYRKNPLTQAPLVQKNEDLFAIPQVAELDLLSGVNEILQKIIPIGAIVYCPLGVGGHLDHGFTRLAAEALGNELRYYADYPYAAHPDIDFNVWLPKEVSQIHETISDEGLAAWQNAVACYSSQLSSFWPSADAMKENLRRYRNSPQGTTFWRVER